MNKRNFFTVILALTISIFSLGGSWFKAQAIADCNYTIEAFAFKGQVFDFSTPIENVTIELYGTNTNDYASPDRVLLDTQTTDINGHVYLTVTNGETINKYSYYFIIEQNLPGYSSIGAKSYSGVVVNPDVIGLAYPLYDKNLVKNKFWDDITSTSFEFSGNVYQGQVGDISTPLPDVTVSLYGSNNPYPTNQVTSLGSTTTDSNGGFSLSITQDSFAYYFLIEQNPTGFISVNAQSVDGSVVTPDAIQYVSPLTGQNLSSTAFWDIAFAGAVTFTGTIYDGDINQTTTPISGIVVQLFGSNTPYPSSQTTLLTSGFTDSNGNYSLILPPNLQIYTYYFLEVPAILGYTLTGATSSSGTVVSTNIIQFTGLVPGETLGGNQFFATQTGLKIWVPMWFPMLFDPPDVLPTSGLISFDSTKP